MKYRLVKRARGWWKVQQHIPMTGQFTSFWLTVGRYRWHWLASLHLWWLRERSL